MSILIRKGRPEDLPEVYKLIQELAEFENAPEEVTNTVERMYEDGYGPNPCYSLLVAEENHIITGIAIYFIKYSTWKGRGLYLDDIVVAKEHRRKGIGRQLFNEVVCEAARLNAYTMHWQVLDWNNSAIEFYKRYLCSFENDWVDCKLTRQQILSFAKK
ncbi:MAG: GNAT family N-acetyltransferase [Bacteroidia bacterium]|nr:GNAT family N-acetyltransferase [Bacteroidia bacterium]MCZ2278298.1 GNAT family N-acetyltransferase [Bacteroidia bacterium]